MVIDLTSLTDDECLAIWIAATRVGAGGPDERATLAAVALVRLALAYDPDGWSFPLWICSALDMGSSNGDAGPQRVKKLVSDMHMAARGILALRDV